MGYSELLGYIMFGKFGNTTKIKIKLLLMHSKVNKKNILYVGNVCEQELFEKIFSFANTKPSQAAQKFQRLLLEGFAQQEEIDRRLESCSDVKNQGKSWQEIKQKFT